MKKSISIFLTVFMVILLSFPVYAAETSSYTNESEMSPMFAYIWQMSAGLGIDSSGKAHYSGSVDVASQYTSELTVSLQKETNNSWSTVKSWADTGTGPGLIVEGDYYVSHGTYRVCSTVNVYNSSGTLLETASIYSAEKTY